MATTTRTDEILAGIQEQLGVMNNQLGKRGDRHEIGEVGGQRFGRPYGVAGTRMDTMNGHLQGLRQDMADMTILVRERIPATGP